MTLDTKARATSQRLIARFGKSISFTSVTDGAYNPATGSAMPTEVIFGIKAIIEQFGRYGEAFSAGLIREGDRKITFAALGLPFTPKPGDKVTFDGDTLTVLTATPTYSGEMVALYMVHGRK